MKILFIVASFTIIFQEVNAQNKLTIKQMDSARMFQLEKLKIYPLISKWGGVIPTEVSYRPDPKRDYKLLFDLYFGRYDSINARVANSGLTTMAKMINLHAASGIPREKMSIIGLIHNTGLDAFFNNEKYFEKYGINNPNLPLIQEYLELGVRFIACGQIIEMNGYSSKDFIPELKIALTIQALISEYVGQGYVKF